MRDLRLIGVHEDGEHLLLADDEGTRFRVPLDDALRAAARQHRPSSGMPAADAEAGHRPRDVQAMIRAGMRAPEVAERCGWTVEKVHRYEVPILAEREYVAGLARLVRLRVARGSSAQSPPTLAGRVTERLATRGVNHEQVSWDSWREIGSEWTVAVTFAAGGRQRQATWSFDPATHSVHARDDEARWLSEDDPSAGGAAARGEVPVYDIEAEGGVNAEAPSPDVARTGDPVDLVTAMRARTSARSRRGSRRRTEDPAAQPLPETASAGPDASPAQPDAPDTDWSAAQAQPDAVEADSPGDTAVAGEREADRVSAPPAPQPPQPAAEPDEAPRAARRGARVPVPSWDEVMFGTKPGTD